MFLVLRWPSGWTFGELLRVGIWISACTALILLLPMAIGAASRLAGISLAIVAAVAVPLAVLGIAEGWLHPLALDPAGRRTSALPAAVSLAAIEVGLALVALVLYSAGRGGSVPWTVSQPRDQGASVAGYLASYLLPLLGAGTGGWRLAAAYVIYVAVLYVVYIRSDGLVLINPTLYLFGLRIYDVRVDSPLHPDRALLLTRLEIAGKTEVSTVPLGDGAHFAKPPSENAGGRNDGLEQAEAGR